MSPQEIGARHRRGERGYPIDEAVGIEHLVDVGHLAPRAQHRAQVAATLVAILSRHCSMPVLETSTISAFG